MNIYKLSNQNNNKFALLLQKVAYPYKYMDNWEKFNETPLLEKKVFQILLKMQDITDADYTHPKRVCKNFEIKNLG